MAGFYLSNKQITGQNIKYIYGGPKPFLKLKSPRETKTFQLRSKEKEEDRVEETQKRMRRRLFDSNSRGEFVVPKAPAFNEVSQNSVDEIVTRLNRPKTAPICHGSHKKDTKKEKKQVTAKALTERDIKNISSRLHCHETYMSRVRNSRGVRPPPPSRRSALERANSAPSHRTNFIEMIKKWNLYQWVNLEKIHIPAKIVIMEIMYECHFTEEGIKDSSMTRNLYLN